MSEKQFAVAVLQLLGAVAFAAFLVILAVSRADARWIVGLGNTVTIFGLVSYWSRSRAGNKWYWPSLVGMLVIHSAALVAIYGYGTRIPLLCYMLLGPVEAAGVYWVLLKVTE